jgi:hypothetical protein
MPGASRAQVASALVAACALLVSAAALWLVYRADQRLDLEQKRQTAAKVYLAEAPRYAYLKHSESGNRPQWVVMNFGVSRVTDMWVEGEDFTSLTIDNVQGCTMYALPVGFSPIAVNFSDIYGRWRVPVGELPDLSGKEAPAQDTADSPWWLDVPNCP